MNRKIALVTGTRAEYGLLCWLMKEIQEDPDLDLQLIVTGMHLSPEFGSTWREIEKDGFDIAAKVEMLLSSDTPVGIAKSTGLGILGFADALDRLKPDILVVLGDRFEILGAVTAAHIARIPVAHIHGGEITQGAVDEAFRHSTTKMAQLHFAAAEPYRKRIIQMGEHPSRVFCTGSPGLDHLDHTDYLSREALAEDLGISLTPPFFLVTYHPVTLQGNPEASFSALLEALEAFPKASVIFTHPNADTEGRGLIRMIESYVSRHPGRACAVASLGQRRYLSVLKMCDAVVGNSSSGLTEAPSFGVPTVNMGDRQKGRLRASSVWDCEETCESIRETLNKALSPEFRQEAAQTINPYGQGGASKKIKEILKHTPLEGLLKKTFFDISFEAE